MLTNKDVLIDISEYLKNKQSALKNNKDSEKNHVKKDSYLMLGVIANRNFELGEIFGEYYGETIKESRLNEIFQL